ncbi:hypothetical protein D3C85_1345260 [compost metagenome]
MCRWSTDTAKESSLRNRADTRAASFFKSCNVISGLRVSSARDSGCNIGPPEAATDSVLDVRSFWDLMLTRILS